MHRAVVAESGIADLIAEVIHVLLRDGAGDIRELDQQTQSDDVAARHRRERRSGPARRRGRKLGLALLPADFPPPLRSANGCAQWPHELARPTASSANVGGSSSGGGDESTRGPSGNNCDLSSVSVA